MIFVTIGSLFPFDRLIRLVDDLAPRWPEGTFFAQIGRGAYEPVNMPFVRQLEARAFAETLDRAELMVAHAGMGSVISALEINRPVVVLPRDMELLEHTTDHQMATARWLIGKPGVYVALRGEDLADTISAALAATAGREPMPTSAPAPFLEKIRAYIDGEKPVVIGSDGDKVLGV